MSKQITRAILDSVVSKAINAAVNTKNPKPSQRKRNKNRKQNQNSTNAPVAQSAQYKSQIPRFLNRSSSSCRISHEEMIGTVQTSIAWLTQDFEINPGLVNTFPWLSSQARGWEKYRFYNLKFIYRTRCSTALSGSVSLFPDYDPSDSAPVSEEIASTYQGFVDDAYWKPQTLTLSRDQLNKERYTRHVNKPTTMSLADYDLGIFFAGSVGAASDGATVGKLYVEYDVEFTVPVLDPTLPLANNNLTMFKTTNLSHTQPFGSNGDYESSHSNYWFSIAGPLLTIKGLVPQGEYFITLQQEGTGFATNTGMTETNISANIYTGVDTLTGTTKYTYTNWFRVEDGFTTVSLQENIATQTTVTYSIITFGQINESI
jgi:hypothetical protein